MLKLPFRLSPANTIFLSMLAGLLVGILFPQAAGFFEPLSTIFIRLVKSLVVPIVFATLVVGIAGHSDLKAVGKMGIKTLIYFEVVTTFALLIGLVMGNLMKPGVGIHLEPAQELLTAPARHMTVTEVVVNIFPQNVIDSAARGDLLEVVIFTVIFASALYMVDARKKAVLLEFCDALSEAMFKYTAIVMKFAPIGVGAAIAVIVGSKGTAVLLKLGMLIFCCYLSILVFMVLVLLPILLFYKHRFSRRVCQ
ncbi:MAG: dicarboxylate/amino acid:cation symporter [Syntrophobacteraceae bacterium]